MRTSEKWSPGLLGVVVSHQLSPREDKKRPAVDADPMSRQDAHEASLQTLPRM